MAEALQRGINVLHARAVLPELPAWLSNLNFVQARAAADPWQVGQLVQDLRTVERQLRLRAAGRNASCTRWKLQDPDKNTPALPAWAADDEEAQKRMVVALGRLALGAAIEAAFVEETLDLCAPGARSNDNSVKTARLYNDAYLAAIWTSAHAQYVSHVQSGVEEPPLPSINSVLNAATELDLSDLFSRRFCPRLCPKSALPLLQVLMRSTYVLTELELYLPLDKTHAFNSTRFQQCESSLPLTGIPALVDGTHC